MANRTAPEAITVRGTNPQYLIEKIIRNRIYESRYWKEECFALTAELLVDKILEMKNIGGCYGGNFKATNFLCLLLKMLQIQPDKEIVIEFIRNEEYKYMRALGAVYIRLVGTALDCYNYLEPLYCDYRKLRYKNTSGKFTIITMDELVDQLLHNERVCDIVMPKIAARRILEELELIQPRKSPLEEDLVATSEEEDAANNEVNEKDNEQIHNKNEKPSTEGKGVKRSNDEDIQVVQKQPKIN